MKPPENAFDRERWVSLSKKLGPRSAMRETLATRLVSRLSERRKRLGVPAIDLARRLRTTVLKIGRLETSYDDSLGLGLLRQWADILGLRVIIYLKPKERTDR